MGVPKYARQSGYDIRCEWGPVGIDALAPAADVVVIVDVLSFTTSVDIAVGRGAVVFPYLFRDATAGRFAKERNALLAGQNASDFTLRPSSLEKIPAGTLLVLPSPNGSALSTRTGKVPTIAGCLRNASAVAAAAAGFGASVAVIPSGERWPDGSLSDENGPVEADSRYRIRRLGSTTVAEVGG